MGQGADQFDAVESTELERSLLPHEEYAQYIGLANDHRDPRAMYMVSKALKRCKWRRYPGDDYIESLALKDVSQKQIRDLRKNLEDCRQLYDILGDLDLFELRDAWLVSAADEGDVFARLELGLHYQSNRTAAQIEADIYESLEESSGDNFLRERSLHSILFYRSKYVDPFPAESALDGTEVLERYSWDYLHCAVSATCDAEWMDQALRDAGYAESTIDEIKQHASSLQAAIDRGDWSALGLTAP